MGRWTAGYSLIKSRRSFKRNYSPASETKGDICEEMQTNLESPDF
jgi:hypothetical protein